MDLLVQTIDLPTLLLGTPVVVMAGNDPDRAMSLCTSSVSRATLARSAKLRERFG